MHTAAAHLCCLSDYIRKLEQCVEENQSCAGPPGDFLCFTEDFSWMCSKLPVRHRAEAQENEDVEDVNRKLA